MVINYKTLLESWKIFCLFFLEDNLERLEKHDMKADNNYMLLINFFIY